MREWNVFRFCALLVCAAGVAHAAWVTDGDLLAVAVTAMVMAAGLVGVWALPHTDEEVEEVEGACAYAKALIVSYWRGK